ncbi:WhiB family transcriptional regulator [Amycolatopsis sp. GM8]|uniref:WhiB family transcriptional regulator n=1 Tax=Amycolatopsis sp. GM8 TaxID=2896530 RepID=UPI0035AB96DE
MTTLLVVRAPKRHVHAARRNADREVDWIDVEPGSNTAADRKETCRLCPVRLTCAITALTTDKNYGTLSSRSTSLTAPKLSALVYSGRRSSVTYCSATD